MSLAIDPRNQQHPSHDPVRNMIRPSVAIVAAACALLAIGLLLKQVRSSSSEQPSAGAVGVAPSRRSRRAQDRVEPGRRRLDRAVGCR